MLQFYLGSDRRRGAGSPDQGVNWPPKIWDWGQKLIPRLCRSSRTGGFWPWPLLKNGSRAPGSATWQADHISFRPLYVRISNVNLTVKLCLFSKRFKAVFYFTVIPMFGWHIIVIKCGHLDLIIKGSGRRSDPKTVLWSLNKVVWNLEGREPIRFGTDLDPGSLFSFFRNYDMRNFSIFYGVGRGLNFTSAFSLILSSTVLAKLRIGCATNQYSPSVSVSYQVIRLFE